MFFALVLHSDYMQLGTSPGQPSDMVRARNAVLTALPTPPGIPEDELKPILLPPSVTIHEFINNTTGVSLISCMFCDGAR